EAFSVGKPVVATAVGGTPEIVEDRKNGLLVQVKDVDGLADAIIELINNEDERRRYGVAGYQRYKNDFSYEKMSERYIEYYEKI
ncbi:MAG: glycosyltransferase family 4 protein, partial [Oscillospiraceae bacterium]|nr:glycosyltransferase family 4 protein [Oscillospiraceae bacterium]